MVKFYSKNFRDHYFLVDCMWHQQHICHLSRAPPSLAMNLFIATIHRSVSLTHLQIICTQLHRHCAKVYFIKIESVLGWNQHWDWQHWFSMCGIGPLAHSRIQESPPHMSISPLKHPSFYRKTVLSMNVLWSSLELSSTWINRPSSVCKIVPHNYTSFWLTSNTQISDTKKFQGWLQMMKMVPYLPCFTINLQRSR